MAGSLGFSEEGESSGVNNVPNPAAIAMDHQKSPEEIISTGSGCVLLSLLKQRNLFEKHDNQTPLNFPFSIADALEKTLTLSTATPPIPIINNNPNSEVAADVDTTPTLSKINVPRVKSIDSAVIYNPTPIRCFHPNNFPEASSSSSSSTNSLLNFDNSIAAVLKRRRLNKKSRTNGEDEEDRRRPLLPTVREFPALMQALESGNRSRAVFLYRKKLESSDVRADLNRLFVTRREWLLRFLTAEEAAALDETAKGVKALGLDQGGKSYSLVLRNWESLNVTVINADWNKITAVNGAVKDGLVEIWGFRQDGKLGFAVIFGRF